MELRCVASRNFGIIWALPSKSAINSTGRLLIQSRRKFFFLFGPSSVNAYWWQGGSMFIESKSVIDQPWSREIARWLLSKKQCTFCGHLTPMTSAGGRTCFSSRGNFHSRVSTCPSFLNSLGIPPEYVSSFDILICFVYVETIARFRMTDLFVKDQVFKNVWCCNLKNLLQW